MTLPIAVQIREAVSDDVPGMALLTAQLGYPVSEADLYARIERILESSAHTVRVAVADGIVLGWITGEVRLSLETGTRAEITGLVVDVSRRRAGLGRALVADIEGWAVQRRVSVILVRSNVTRNESHPFYEQLGYQLLKTQHSYKRTLPAVEQLASRLITAGALPDPKPKAGR